VFCPADKVVEAKEKADGQAQLPCEESSIDLENHHPHQPRTETDSMPSPKGEGQTDTPINRHNRGEVPGRFDLFITPPHNRLIQYSPASFAASTQ